MHSVYRHLPLSHLSLSSLFPSLFIPCSSLPFSPPNPPVIKPMYAYFIIVRPNRLSITWMSRLSITFSLLSVALNCCSCLLPWGSLLGVSPLLSFVFFFFFVSSFLLSLFLSIFFVLISSSLILPLFLDFCFFLFRFLYIPVLLSNFLIIYVFMVWLTPHSYLLSSSFPPSISPLVHPSSP